MPSLPLYWGGRELCEKLYANKLIAESDYEVCRILSDLNKREKLRRSTLLVPESGVHRVMQDGLFTTSEGFLQLTNDDRLAYIDTIQAFLEEKKSNGEFFVIPNHIPNIDRLPTNIIYSDGVSAFYLRANQIDAYNGGRFFYKIHNGALANIVHCYLAELRFIENNDFLL